MITRDALKDDWLAKLAVASGDRIRISTEEELANCLRTTLANLEPGQDVWVFAYGSLIWNPAFHYSERKTAMIYGYHRSYCLWTKMGRGTEECPGLMLGLDRGGSCAGVAYRVPADQIDEELPLIWRREMVTGSYKPTWLATRIDGQSVRSLGFVINRDHERYARGMSHDELIHCLANACGPLGTCAEYLFNTSNHLIELGIRDRGLEKLCRDVEARLSQPEGLDQAAQNH